MFVLAMLGGLARSAMYLTALKAVALATVSMDKYVSATLATTPLTIRVTSAMPSIAKLTTLNALSAISTIVLSATVNISCRQISRIAIHAKNSMSHSALPVIHLFAKSATGLTNTT